MSLDFPFNFGQKSSLLLIFFFHGITFTFLLLRKWRVNNDNSSKWLGILLFLYALYICPFMLGYAGWYSIKTTREILFFIPFMQVLLIGPIVYFYTRSLLDSSFKLSLKEWGHFVPAALYLLYSLIVFVTDKIILDAFYFYDDGRDKDLSNWYQIAGVLSLAIYLVLSLAKYSEYKKLVFETVSYADSILFTWLRNFLVVLAIVIMLRVLFFITNPEWGEFGSQFWYYLVFSFLFYYISLNGYANAIKKDVLSAEISKPVSTFDIGETFKETEQKQDHQIKNIEDWKKRTELLMKEDELYKNPKLTLSDVADALDTNAKTISIIVNSGFNLNFNDFINYYRVEAVKNKLKNGDFEIKTLLGIALDCGFNSKATFNRAFKKSTSLSPQDYLKKIAEK